MVDQERRHAETGRIADTQLAANLRIQPDGGSRCRHPRHMFGQIDREGPDQPDSQHFRLEGTGEFGAGGPVRAVGGAELAGAVDGRRAHQIADLVDHGGVGLRAGSQRLDHMPEQPHGFVGAREHHLGVGDPAGFLFRNIRRQAFDLRGVDLAVTQREGGVPCLGNHPVGAQAVIQLMRKGDKGVGVLRAGNAVGGNTDPALVNVKDRAVEMPALVPEAAKQHAHEAQPALVERAKPRQPHHRPRVTQRRFGHIHSLFRPVHMLSHLPLQSWRQRMPASSRP